VHPACTGLRVDVADRAGDEVEVELPVAVDVKVLERVLVADKVTAALLVGVPEPLAVPVDVREAKIEADTV
jgi:hypothetical protein